MPKLLVLSKEILLCNFSKPVKFNYKSFSLKKHIDIDINQY